MPTPKTTKPGPAPRFTREQIFEAALRVIDREPADALTMRLLADEIGVAPMTIYGYVSGKEEILEGATLIALREVGREKPPGGSWEEVVGAGARDLHEVCRRHPKLAALVVGLGSPAPGLFRVREQMLGSLLDAGFTREPAMKALGALTNYALGFAGAQAAMLGTDLLDRIRELRADEFPNLTDAAEDYGLSLSDEAFEHGLELLIAGFRAELDSGRD